MSGHGTAFSEGAIVSLLWGLNTGIERNITLFKTFCSASFQPQIAVKVCTSFFVFWQLNCLLMSQLILRRGAEMIMHPRLHFRCVNKHYLTSGLTSGNLPMCSRLISLSETECCTSKASLPLLITCSVSGWGQTQGCILMGPVTGRMADELKQPGGSAPAVPVTEVMADYTDQTWNIRYFRRLICCPLIIVGKLL